MSPPAHQRAERIARDVRIAPHVAPQPRGADGAARHPYHPAKHVRRRRVRPRRSRSHKHLGCNPLRKLRKCLTFPVRLWEDVRCNAGIVVTEQAKAEWSRGRSDWGSRGRSALPVRRRSARYGAGGDITAPCPYVNPAGEMFAYVRLCSLMFA